MAIADAYNYRRINNTVSTSGIPTRDQLGGLKAEGFEAVVNLLPDESLSAVAGEGDVVLGQGLEYYHIPVDFEDPTEEDFNAFSQALVDVGDKKWLPARLTRWITLSTSPRSRSGWATPTSRRRGCMISVRADRRTRRHLRWSIE